MTLRPVLFRIVLCTAVALALWGWIAHEAPTGNAPEAGNRPALALQRELPTEVGEANSFPGIGPVASENPAAEAGSADGSAQAPPAERSGADEESREADSDPQNRRVVSTPLDVDALKAGDESTQAIYKRFLTRIEKEGSVPLIIGLSAPVAPESSLVDPGEVDQQRQMLTAVQDIVLTDLAGVATDGVKRFETIPYLALTVDAEGLTALVDSDPVITIEEDVAVPAALLDSVPLIGATPLHSSAHGYDGTGVTVAILDTGVDKTHQFLDGGKVVSEACYSTNRAADHATSTCPGGVANSTASGSGVACDYPGCDHGTWVAGIAAGKDGTGATGGTLQGVAPGASIIAIQVFSKIDDPLKCDPDEKCVLAYISDYMKGLERVYALRDTYEIAAANLSLGGGLAFRTCDHRTALKRSIDNLRAAGIATVTSSGNGGFDGMTSRPACISNIIAVGASDKKDKLWPYSDHASWVDVIAPGVAIQSSVLDGAYKAGSGTSAAAPHVTGCFALYKDKYPSASVTTIEGALESTAPVFLSRGGISKPRIDCHAAIVAPVAAGPLAPQGLANDATPTYSWRASPTATSYYLWVDRGANPVHKATYTAAQAGCAVGTGTCSVTPSVVLYTEAYTWRIQARNRQGIGRWSARIGFSVQGPPGPTTLISPRDTVNDELPTYSWKAVGAAWTYELQVDRGASTVHRATYTAVQAGCVSDFNQFISAFNRLSQPGLTCSVKANALLQRGAHSWRIKTGNYYGAGPSSEPMVFTVRVVGLPGAATLISPHGQTLDTTPTYRWNAVDNATSYGLAIRYNESVLYPYHSQDIQEYSFEYYTAEQAGCAGGVGTCSITPSVSLGVGPGSWRILTRNAKGRGLWSEKRDFQVGTVPGAPTLISPLGIAIEIRPTYKWKAVATALRYELEVRDGSDIVFTRLLFVRPAYRSYGLRCYTLPTCTVTPQVTLPYGAQSWRVRAWNHNGYGPWSEKGSIGRVVPPGGATLIAPKGTTTDTTPTYRWNAEATATAYYLGVNRGSNKIIGIWYTAAQTGCAAGTGTCSLTPSTALQNGAHTWWIQTKNLGGEGPESASMRFAVISPPVASPPVAATLIAPKGTTTDTTPTYSWNAVAAATHYYLWVSRGSSKVIGTWYTAAQAECATGTGTCRITPSTALQSGDHAWWIQTWNAKGRGPWSARSDFTVDTDGGS